MNEMEMLKDLFEVPELRTRTEAQEEKEKSFDVLRTLLALETVCRRLSEQFAKKGDREKSEHFSDSAELVKLLSEGESRRYSRIRDICDEMEAN